MITICGIAGFSLATDERCYPTRVAAVMLKAIEHRGPHATGAAWVDPKTGQVWVHKDAVTASVFVRNLDLGGGRTAMLHTRWATKGDPSNNDNNHPIDVTGVVGIHNGQVRNDDAIFAALGERAHRAAQVDSEAIFAAIKAETEGEAHQVLATLEGTAAVAWFDVDPEGFNHSRTLHLARVKGSPLWIGYTPKGSTLFASTRKAVQAGAAEMNTTLTFLHQVEEGTYFKMRLGRVSTWSTIPGVMPTVHERITPLRCVRDIDAPLLRPATNRRQHWVDDHFLDDMGDDDPVPDMPDVDAGWAEWDEWCEANDEWLRRHEGKR